MIKNADNVVLQKKIKEAGEGSNIIWKNIRAQILFKNNEKGGSKNKVIFPVPQNKNNEQLENLKSSHNISSFLKSSIALRKESKVIF